jgi:hypothetical protein
MGEGYSSRVWPGVVSSGSQAGACIVDRDGPFGQCSGSVSKQEF